MSDNENWKKILDALGNDQPVNQSTERPDNYLKSSACPPIHSAIPDWPFRNKKKSFWIGLKKSDSIFTHHPSFSVEKERYDHENKDSSFQKINDFFCCPVQQSERLEAIIKGSYCGSVLVTGYRGTGKSSLVNYTIAKLTKEAEEKNVKNKEPENNRNDDSEDQNYIPVRINLSTSRTARSLVFIMIKEIFLRRENRTFGDLKDSISQEIQRMYYRSVGSILLESIEGSERGASAQGSLGTKGVLGSLLSAGVEFSGLKRQTSSERKGHHLEHYSLHEAQQDLHHCLGRLRKQHFSLIFIFDELDKLTPEPEGADRSDSKSRLVEMQRIVSDLKYLLAETNAWYVFIAGKDVDDSWQEDQNKGEGLFESVFVQNIYLPSVLSAHLRPMLGSHASWIRPSWHSGDNAKTLDQVELPGELDEEWTELLLQDLLKELGIGAKTWTYNTALLIVPHFSATLIKQILLRSRRRESSGKREWLERLDLSDAIEPGPITERRCRRIRYILQYFTYKGRGIPRKILREFYAMVGTKKTLTDKSKDYWKNRGEEIEYLLSAPTTTRQKLKFFSSIVARLEAEPEVFRTLDDKACVATFHIIDYILKFYRTGFSWTDIEYASFMTKRQDLLASRVLVTTILEILEGFLLERYDHRRHEYRLLPRIKHDLAGLYLAFGPEQIELRFTSSELDAEIQQLESSISRLDGTNPDQRLESFTAQIRLAKIYEDLGDYGNARRAYGKAVRWIRADIGLLRSAQSRGNANHILETTELITYIGYAVDILQRMGYLYEVVRDYNNAAQYYREAIRLNEAGWIEGRREEEFALYTLEKNIPEKDRRDPRWKVPVSTLGPRIDFYDSEIPNPASRQRTLSNPKTTKDGPEEKIFRNLFNSMLPEDLERETLRFTSNAPANIAKIRPLYSAHDMYGLPLSLNLLAFVSEKMWHRYACNRFLLIALNYYTRISDRYGMINQITLIAEVHLRRRDLRTAASWYQYALSVLSVMQVTDAATHSTRIPDFRSDTRAELFERLGDIYFASDGFSFASTETLKSAFTIRETSAKAGPKSPIRENCHNNVRSFIDGLRWNTVEDRDDELFYTYALQSYRAESHSLLVADIYMKKMLVRHQRLKTNIEHFGHNESDAKQSKERCEQIRSWCSFWSGAAKALDLLIDVRPGVVGVHPLDWGRIVDRRRFGVLFRHIGILLFEISRSPSTSSAICEWIWKGQDEESERRIAMNCSEAAEFLISDARNKEESGFGNVNEKRAEEIFKEITSIEVARRRMDLVFGFLLDNKELAENDLEDREVGYWSIRDRSQLWQLGSGPWRRLIGDGCEEFLDGIFLTTLLRHAMENALQSASSVATPDTAPSITSTDSEPLLDIIDSLRIAQPAEIALLGCFLCLDDSIRDYDTGQASQALGRLYLDAIRFLLAFLKNLERNGKTIEKSYWNGFARIYAFLHLASKRYLVTAVDVWHEERLHERTIQKDLGDCHVALGDLLLVRAEILDHRERKSEVSGILPSSQEFKDSFKAAIDDMKDHIQDRTLQDVRQQAVESYRDACMQFQREIESYTTRYHIPEEVYLLHGDISDRRLHFEICRTIQARHWDYEGLPHNGKLARKKLDDIWQLLSVTLSESYSSGGSREDWLRGLWRKFWLAAKLSTTGSVLSIIKPTEQSDHWLLAWPKKFSEGVGEPERAEASAVLPVDVDHRDLHRYFRSYDDGLGLSKE